jgi:hypothetical protein
VSLSLGNRSAVFFELGNWKQCLSDIEVTKSFRFLVELEYADDCFIGEQSDFKIIYNGAGCSKNIFFFSEYRIAIKK